MEVISIHAPREGSDISPTLPPPAPRNFYPRSPRGERRATWTSSKAATKFLSTLPARGATHRYLVQHGDGQYFYPRSPRGERQTMDLNEEVKHDISIHAPREGSDIQGFTCFCIRSAFLSTLPARGATSGTAGSRRHPAFLSTLPARGATAKTAGSSACRSFLSTLPARGATRHLDDRQGREMISIHAPREGSDSKCAEK